MTLISGQDNNNGKETEKEINVSFFRKDTLLMKNRR